MVQQMREAIEDGVSVMAVDPANQDKLVGFRTAFTVSRFQLFNFNFKAIVLKSKKRDNESRGCHNLSKIT